MKRQLISLTLVFIVAIAFTASPAFAASKVRMTVYDQVIKSGNYVYCPAEGDGFYKVRMQEDEVVQDGVQRLVRTHFVRGGYTYNMHMKKMGKYLYYIEGSEGTYYKLRRVNLTTGKRQMVANYGTEYAIRGHKIYAQISKDNWEDSYTRYRVMKMDGKNKKKTSARPAMKTKRSNVKGYSVSYVEHWVKEPEPETIAPPEEKPLAEDDYDYDEDYDDDLEGIDDEYVDYVETYLKTPAGTFFLGRSYTER